MENPRRNFLRTITSAAALPALMSIVESACETELGKSLVVSQDFRTHFPILKEAVNGKSLVYLDSAATTTSESCAGRAREFLSAPERKPCEILAPAGSTVRGLVRGGKSVDRRGS